MSSEIVFSLPRVLWLLPLLLPWAWWRWRAGIRAAVPWPALQLAGPVQRPVRRVVALVAELLLLAVLVVGAAGPQRRSALERVTDEGVDIVVVLDVSLSMLATDIAPDRLTVLRRTARTFVRRVGEARIGIVIFAGDVHVHTPMTSSRRAVERLLDSVTVHTLNHGPSGGTAIGDALLVAGDRLRAVRRPGRDQAVVLITDGENNVGTEPELAARWLREAGVHLHVVGVGGREPVTVTFQGAPVGSPDRPYLAVLDDASLESLSRAGGGRWYRATDETALRGIFAELDALESAPLETETVVLRRPASAPWAIAAVLLFGVHLLVGVDARRPLR